MPSKEDVKVGDVIEEAAHVADERRATAGQPVPAATR